MFAIVDLKLWQWSVRGPRLCLPLRDRQRILEVQQSTTSTFSCKRLTARDQNNHDNRTGIYAFFSVRESGTFLHTISEWFPYHTIPINQDHGKGGLSLRGVAVTTETAITAETVKTATVFLIVLYFVGKQKEGKVLSSTAKTVKTAKAVMKATPLKLNPPFPPAETFQNRVEMALRDADFCLLSWSNVSRTMRHWAQPHLASCISIASANYRIEKPQIPENMQRNRQKIGEK